MRSLTVSAVLLLAFVPNLRVFISTYDEFPGSRDERVRNALLTNSDLRAIGVRQQVVEEYRDVGRTVDELVPPDSLVLLDVLGLGGAVPIFTDYPRRFVTTTDRAFEDSLAAPWDSVDYVLVQFPTFEDQMRSVVLQRYEGIWEGEQPWTQLEAEIPGPSRWRLYRVLNERPAAANQ